jgi:hypothetical protein
MNKQTAYERNDIAIKVGQMVSVLWKYDQVTKTIYWLGDGQYIGKLIPDAAAAGLQSELCRITNTPCDAVRLSHGEIVYDTECFFFPRSFWQTEKARSISALRDVDIGSIREAFKNKVSFLKNASGKGSEEAASRPEAPQLAGAAL